MSVCEFCRQFQKGECRVGLNIPKTMSCREFDPSMDQFCSDRKDFVDYNQIIQMAKFFGFQRTELKKIKLMATQEETTRAEKQKADRAVNDLSEVSPVPVFSGIEER